MTVLRRFDCLLAQTKPAVLKEQAALRGRPESVVRGILERITGRPFYNLSKLDFPRLLDAPNDIATNLSAYIKAFSPNVREVMERFAFDQQIARMNEKNLLYEVIKAFARLSGWRAATIGLSTMSRIPAPRPMTNTATKTME